MTASNSFSWGRHQSQSMSVLSLASLLIAVLTIPFVFYLSWRSRKKDEKAKLPPGPRGLPLLGNLPFLRPDLHRCFAELARTHGPVMRLRLGSKLCVVLSSPAAVKEALKDQDAVFANHDAPAVALASPYGRNSLLWEPYGPPWRVLRKVTVRELLSRGTIEGLYALRRREVRRMVEHLRRRAGEPVEVRELVYATTLNATTMMLWGGTVAEAGEGKEALGREFRQAMDAVVELLGLPNVSDFFPALAWLDVQGLARRMGRLVAWLDRILNSIIDHRLRTMERDGAAAAASSKKESRDFLQVMLEVLQEGDPQAPLTLQQIKTLFVELVAGGTDTTSTTVEWAMTELLCNPQMMSKAKEEIAAVVTRDNVVEETHLPELHYLAAVVKEVLRLHPILPLLIPHCPSSSCTIAGYRIPKGTKVFINVWAIHRDPLFWDDASKFEPERFLGANQELDYTGNNLYYLPFGAGRRICVGLSLGEKMVMYILATLLHSFDWTLPEGVKLDLSEKLGLMLKKEKALVAVPT